MSNCLLLTQALRLLKSDDIKSISHMGYWLGELLVDFLPGIEAGNHSRQVVGHFGYLASLITDAC